MIAVPQSPSTPFNLSSLRDGIYLEHINKRLDWFSTPREAKGKLGREAGMPDSFTLACKEVLALGGLAIQISGRFLADLEQDNSNGTLRQVEFRVYQDRCEPLESLYRRVKRHLCQNLGEPILEYHAESEDSYRGSFTEWDSEDVMVMWRVARGEGGPECVGEIWCKPLPRQYLKQTVSQI